MDNIHETKTQLSRIVERVERGEEVTQALGKLSGPPDLLDCVAGRGLVELPIRSRHAIEAVGLPPLHRDPFDRMLVAQARCDGLTLISRDPRVQCYDVPVTVV